ncbi:MAG: hypothetical protein MRY64_10160, partial [Hyphomonadaceae bacterium]|nr:hypothetical protein [Hyphomonadaceae bacterium]
MRSFSLSLLVAAAAPLALAQEDVSPWEVEVDGDLAVVVALGMEEEAGDIAPQSGLWEASLGFGAERTLQSGTTIGARAVLRAARDHPARPAGTGNLALATAQGPAGAYSQLAFGPEFANQGARASLETAYLFVETGYG